MNWDLVNKKLRHRLLNPPSIIDAAELPNLWRQTEIEFLVELPKGHEEGAWTVRHIRSALLDHLFRTFPDNGPGEMLRAPNVHLYGNEVPSPLLISVEQHNEGLKVRLTLFGVAEIFKEPIIEAFALAVTTGVRITEKGRVKAKAGLKDFRWRRIESITIPEIPSPVLIQPLTPIRQGYDVLSKPLGASIMNSLLQRQTALCRWMGYDLKFSDTDIFERARAVHFNISVEHFQRGYSFPIQFEKGDRRFRYGHMNVYELSNISSDIWPFLCLGQLSAMGSDIIKGFGQYKVLGTNSHLEIN